MKSNRTERSRHAVAPVRLVARSVLLALLVVPVGWSCLSLGAPLPRKEKTEPKPEAAVPRDLPGETEHHERLFTPLSVPESALAFKDPVVAALADRIASGRADLRDRRAWYMIELLYSPFTSLPPEGWRERALRQGESLSVEARRREAEAAAQSRGDGESAALAPVATYTWSSLGPVNYNVGGSDLAQGRASALWVHPTNTNFILAGFADGGVWKTTNGGALWTPISDFEASTSVGSIDVLIRTDTVNLTDAIIYVGLGEGNTASSSVDGAGVLKSTNGGATWTLQELPWAGPDAAVSARFRRSIRRILIDRNAPNAQSVWVAGDGGVYRTTDGGASWSLVTALPYTGKPGVGGCWPELATDFVIDTTTNPSILYVAFGARSNASSVAVLSCTGVANDVNFRKNNGVYRSADGGANWTHITGPGSGFPAIPGRVGRIALAQAPSNKKQIYAIVSCVTNGAQTCPNGQFSSLGIFRTADATAPSVTWTAGSTTNFCANQGWFNLTGAVDPTNPAKLLVGGLDMYLSTDSAATLSRKSFWTGSGTAYVHADQHHIVYANTSTVFVACDGGIFRGTVSGTTITWTNLNAGGLSTLQFYGIAQHPTIANRIHGGLQDNGEAYTANGASWTMTQGGDGGFSATDPSNGDIAYQEYVYAGVSRSVTGGAGGWTCIQNFGGCGGCGLCIPDGQTAFIAPMTLDANNPAVLYTATKYVYRNSDARSGASWSAISPDLVGTSYDHIVHVHSGPNGGAPGTLWATTLNGKVWISRDDGASWTDTTKAPLPDNPVLPNRAATWLATHPADGRRAIVVFSGWNGSGNQPGHVFRTQDGGAAWANISGPLPDEPVFTVAVDPSRPNEVYIGTEFSVYVNTDAWGGASWTKINAGQLPSAHVHQLEFSRANGKLRAATHGRGIWELTVTCPTFVEPVLAAPTVTNCGAQLAWTPSGQTGARYNVYRALGSCPSTPYDLIASGLAGTSYLDTDVSGGLTYSYKVTTTEEGGSCESAASACRTVAVPGSCPCALAPAFAGLAAVTTPNAATCALDLTWTAASPLCGAGSAVYNIHRSTSPGFTPSASNRIATCVTGTSFGDQGGLVDGQTYYYAVRAEDASGQGSGPCRAGNEDTNTARRSARPAGVFVPGTFADGAEGAPLMTLGTLWSQSAARARAGARSYFGNAAPTNSCSALVTPILRLGPSGSPSVLAFYSWRDNLESTWDGGIVEISSDDGITWTKLALTPGYPSTFDAASTSCASTAQAPARAGFTGTDSSWQGVYTADLSPWADRKAQVRFLLGTDPAVLSTGWYLDDIQVTNAAQASACSTATAAVPEVSSRTSGRPLLARRDGAQMILRFEEIAGAGGYNIYQGELASWYSHAGAAANLCGAPSLPAAPGTREAAFTPAAGSRYYLVTAYTTVEGPAGYSTSGEIPAAASTCAP